MTMLAVLAGVKDLLQNCSGIGVDGFSKVEREWGGGGGVVEQGGEKHGVPELRLGQITFLCHNCCYASAPDLPSRGGAGFRGGGAARETSYKAAFFSLRGVMGV